MDQLKYCKPGGLTFGLFSSKEIARLSVVEVVTPISFNVLGHPLPGGLYDPALGPSNFSASCSTCANNINKCPGHMGHIEIPLPVVNPLFASTVNTILKLSCLNCFRVLLPPQAKSILSGQLRLLSAGYIAVARQMSDMYTNVEMTWGGKPEDIASQASLIEKIDSFISEALASPDMQPQSNNKGETNYRNEFLKMACGFLFKGKKCPYCTQNWKIITFIRRQALITKNTVEVAKKFSSKGSEVDSLNAGSQVFLTPSESKKYFQKLWENDSQFLIAFAPLLGTTCEANPTDLFFMTVIPVTPTNCRPTNFVNGTLVEHPSNNIYKAILNDCIVMRNLICVINKVNFNSAPTDELKAVLKELKGKTNTEKLQFAWHELQTNVDSLLDAEAKKSRAFEGLGLKQIIEKKEGIIRMNMMGKRVNFAARSVITPDPNLNIDEIGIPEAFAKKLTYPVPVTVWNVTELRKLIMNGPDVHPGANVVENEDGSLIKLDPKDVVQRESVAKRLLTPGEKKGLKVLHRHLLNGDVLLLNRQPTLHRPSIMAHRARILKGEKTLRLHYANCKSYNADFDGDEMNAHFPQNEVARSEGYNLVSVSKQYLVPKDGTPLSGLIQDHVVSGVRLSIRGKFFTRDEYLQLVFQGLSFLQGDIKILPPAIIKPVRLWSGKQIISTIIINVIPRGKVLINLNSTAKIGYKAWEKCKLRPWAAGGTPFNDPRSMTEAEVIIRSGELLCGVLDKMHYGSTPYSLVHCVYELYGGDVSCQLLSSFAKLFTSFLQREGFTLGVSDILVVKEADKQRKEFIKKLRRIGDEVAERAVDSVEVANKGLPKALEEAHKKIPMFRAQLDHEYKKALDSYTNDINKSCVPAGLSTPFPHNNLQLMVQSGAKGSTVNTMQISCLLGQIELEGKRPPLMISGKSLPSFKAYDTSPRAGGFIDGRFMTGIQPQEFFFHCMAGREGLIDTAVKTSRSGYLQRCLIKHLESLIVNYDMTVRDSDGSIVQYCYGEDGLEVSKCQFLKENQIQFLEDNMSAVFDSEVNASLKEATDTKGVKAYKKVLRNWQKSHNTFKMPRGNGFTLFSQEVSKDLPTSSKLDSYIGRDRRVVDICKKWFQLEDSVRDEYRNKWPSPPDPISSKFQADRHLGSLTEKLDGVIKNYIKKKDKSKRLEIIRMMEHKFLLSTCCAGEPVGLLAAQSVGEPSTQMTLNTFHFAGRGEMNVTLGIPRLREILMVASKNIKTPTMEVPFHSNLPGIEKKVNRLRKYLKQVTLADVLESISVTEKIAVSPVRKQVYKCCYSVLIF
ncbi:hypothetical protein AAG570_013534 [Ranatra chinensis]|uniref:DNA-directed RNA polymerase subunit n=1 Tax=Ranatra chinensis TaxID=642074 RepID=A0ABD0YCP2_9HEMI